MSAPHRLPPREAYALWADSYPPVVHNPLMQTEQLVVEPLLASVRPTRALDVGTGSGRYLPVLAAAGASTIVGVDFSREMLAQAKGQPGARICADGRRLPFAAATFDLVNASLMAGDIADLPSWLVELSRVLEPGGHLIYSDFHPVWAANGWRRTFDTIRGDTVELPFEPHSIEHHVEALEQARFNLLGCYEPLMATGVPSVETFRQRWGNPAVLTVVFARKT